MSWAVSLKLVAADVDAKADATRAQVAEMLMLTADLKGTEAPATETTVPAEEVNLQKKLKQKKQRQKKPKQKQQQKLKQKLLLLMQQQKHPLNNFSV